MKTLKMLVMMCMFCSVAQAQYALRIGQKIVPIKSGDNISKRDFFEGQAYLLFLPDSLYPNSGINSIQLVTVDDTRKAKTYHVNGNLLFSPMMAEKDTQIREVWIQQIRNKNNHVRPVKIRLKLVD